MSLTTSGPLSATSPTTTSAPDVSDSGSPSTTTTTQSTTSTTAEQVTSTVLPLPFDTSLGSNFTAQSCPNFFGGFLSNPIFRSCIPISLLLQNSNSFFRAERDPVLMDQTLDAACSAPVDSCTTTLKKIATDLIQNSNCGADYLAQNPIVTQAYNGLLAYEPLHRATCLKDPKSRNYCFANAIGRATSESDAYPYYTPLGLPLPVGSQPTCSPCLQQTMQIYQSFAVDPIQPLSKTYPAAAGMVNDHCGADFVSRSVSAVADKTSAGPRTWDLSRNTVVLATLATVVGLMAST